MSNERRKRSVTLTSLKVKVKVKVKITRSGLCEHLPKVLVLQNRLNFLQIIRAIKLVYSDNCHAQSRHIDTKYNFIKEKVTNKKIDFSYTYTKEMIADAFTKPVIHEENDFCNDSIDQ